MASKSFKASGSNLSMVSDVSESQSGKPPLPPRMRFGWRTASGKYVNLSRDDLDSELGSGDYVHYTVQIPTTPDHQPMDSISQKVEEQYVSNSLFTGGFNSNTRAHLMDKVIESDANHPQMAGIKGSPCSVPGCDAHVMRDERGIDIVPCDCEFKICRECYLDAVRTGGGICPGCKEEYNNIDSDELTENGQRLSLPAPPGTSRMERRLTLLRSTKSILRRSQTGDFDQNRWLFETKGTYGCGNAIWPKDGGFVDGKNNDVEEPTELSLNKPWRPLTRKLKISAAILSPYRYIFTFLQFAYDCYCCYGQHVYIHMIYEIMLIIHFFFFCSMCYRLLILIRMVVLAFFLAWRVNHPNKDAIWLWGMSVVCEIWFAFSWILDQLPRLCPINRATDLNILKEKFETPSQINPTGKSDLPGIDVFVSTADPEKEPPLVTANTILSILAANYPVEKLACYVSDDGGALLTFEAMAEAASFANVWVPFCRKHDIEPRNPESYFNMKKDPYKKKVRPDFVKDRRRVKREYDEFKVRINSLPDSIHRRSDACHAREEIKAQQQQRQKSDDELVENSKIPKATWMADESHWPGTWINPAPEHSWGDHAGIIQVSSY